MSAGPVLEPHYTVAEISKKLNLSKDAVRSLFQNEPGVFVLGDINHDQTQEALHNAPHS